MSLIDEYEFKKCVARYKGDRHAIKFNCRGQVHGDELCSVLRPLWFERY